MESAVGAAQRPARSGKGLILLLVLLVCLLTPQLSSTTTCQHVSSAARHTSLSESHYDIDNRVLNLKPQPLSARQRPMHRRARTRPVTRTRPSRHAIFMWLLLLQPCRAPLRASHVAQFLSPFKHACTFTPNSRGSRHFEFRSRARSISCAAPSLPTFIHVAATALRVVTHACHATRAVRAAPHRVPCPFQRGGRRSPRERAPLPSVLLEPREPGAQRGHVEGGAHGW
jgi:hypothetical protein